MLLFVTAFNAHTETLVLVRRPVLRYPVTYLRSRYLRDAPLMLHVSVTVVCMDIHINCPPQIRPTWGWRDAQEGVCGPFGHVENRATAGVH